MTVDELTDELADLVAEVGEVDRAVVVLDAAFDDVGIDSLLAIEIAVHVEHRYNTSFTEAELGTLQTFRDLVTLTRSHVSG